MTDIAVAYTLTTPGTDVTFNGGAAGDGTNMYYLTDIQGLDGAPIRAPIDNAPQAHGGLIHNFWKGPRHIAVEGAFLIQTTRNQAAIQTLRNSMTETLLSALEALYQADGTLTWTPLGGLVHSLTVRYEIPLQTAGIELRTFTFGLVAADPDPALST